MKFKYNDDVIIDTKKVDVINMDRFVFYDTNRGRIVDFDKNELENKFFYTVELNWIDCTPEIYLVPEEAISLFKDNVQALDN